MSWDIPRDWQEKEAFTAIKFNKEIRDKLNYLKNKPKVEVRSAEGFTTTSNTMVAVDDKVFRLELETFTSEIIIELVSSVKCSTLNAEVNLNVWVDDSYYLGAGENTDAYLGSFLSLEGVNYDNIIQMNVLVKDLAPGLHTFSLHWRVTAGTAEFRASTGLKHLGPYFSVRET
ncbi:hypothetical protein LCGC14_0939040 [marine sediment metagenome]|uniref:Uncharacterized protein n=1 Tax=marine sediment metagenome TaxID=412755 RepID=A0A0F9R487_9ZZZZ